MASTYTSNSGVEKPGIGDQSGEWGTTVNTNMDILDRAINGVGVITLSGTTHTLTTTDGALSDGQYKVLVLSGSPSGTNTITISPNDQDKLYFVVNNSGQTATFSQGSGANVSVVNGDTKIIYADGAGSGAAVTEFASEVDALEGITAGTVAASKAVIVDANKDITGFRNVTLAGDMAVSGSGNRTAFITSTDGIASMEIGSAASNAAFIDLKTPSSDDYDVRLSSSGDGAGGSLIVPGGTFSILGTDLHQMATFADDGAASLYYNNAIKIATASGGITVTGEVAATSLDISGDADIDGTLEADAMTLDGTAITTTATLSTGISNNNVPVFTTGVADDDFLRVAGTSIEGRSASEVLSDIGGQASLTFGISNTNAVKIDSASVADDEYARFTASGLESRSTAEVLSDIGASPVAGSGSIVTTGALNSGSITSGFGSIDNGSSAITTTGAITGGSLEIDGAGSTATLLFTNDATAAAGGGGLNVSIDNSLDGYLNNAKAGALKFGTSNVERMRIDSSGRVLINQTSIIASDTAPLQVTGGSVTAVALKGGTNNYFMAFYNTSNSLIGSITGSTGSTTYYNTTSDYRLKENVNYTWDATSQLKQLKPAKFNFIADPDNTVDGFIAHEVQEVVPHAVTGVKDGKEMQVIDHSKLVPLLTASLQEALKRIDSLEEQVNALKGK